MIRILLVVMMGGALAGCGSALGNFTCDQASVSGNNKCTYYTNVAQSVISCTGGTITSGDVCGSTARVGRCSYTTTGDVTTTIHYYTTANTAGTAQTACTALSGTFTAN